MEYDVLKRTSVQGEHKFSVVQPWNALKHFDKMNFGDFGDIVEITRALLFHNFKMSDICFLWPPYNFHYRIIGKTKLFKNFI